MKKSTISFLTLGVIAVVFLVMGFVKGASAKKLIARCTESAPGVIVDVDSKLVRRKRSSHTEYCGTVEFTPNGASKPTTFETEWTSITLTEGTQTTVHYDPGDPDVAYTDKVQPEGAVPSFITAGILAVVGVIMFVVNRAKGN